MGHISSLWSARGDTAMVVLSIIVSWGLRCSSYKLRSRFMATTHPGREKIDVTIERVQVQRTMQCALYETRLLLAYNSANPSSASNANGMYTTLKLLLTWRCIYWWYVHCSI